MRVVVICLFSLSLIISPIAKGQSLASDLTTIQFQWESRDRLLLDAQRNFLNEQKGQVGSVREKDLNTRNPAAILLYVTVGVAAISALADAIVKTLKDTQHGGLIVDMQSPTIKIIENPSLDRGQIIVRKQNGDVESYVHKSGSSTDLSSIIAGLLTAAKQP